MLLITDEAEAVRRLSSTHKSKHFISTNASYTGTTERGLDLDMMYDTPSLTPGSLGMTFIMEGSKSGALLKDPVLS